MADLEGFEERYGLNSRLVKRDGPLVEEVYRVGGRYGGADRAHRRPPLERRRRSRRDADGKALSALITFYQTGETADRVAYDIAWVEDKDSPVDTINGFIEVYMDARGVKGAWEALVFFVNHEKTRASIARLKPRVVRGADAVGSASAQGWRHGGHRATRSTSSSKPAIRARSRRSASTCRTIRRSASGTAASPCRSPTSTRRTRSRSRRRTAASSAGPPRRPSARRNGARLRAS